MKNKKDHLHFDQGSNQNNTTPIISSSISFILMAVLASVLSSCSIIVDIFQAGMGFGIFIVLAIAVLIVYLIMRVRKK